MSQELALIRTTPPEAIVSVFPETVGRIDLPGVGQLSPPQDGWEGDGYRIAAIEPSVTPAGKQRVSPGVEGVELVNGLPTWILTDLPPEPRRQVPKAIVEQRLIEAGLMDAAFAALSSSGVLFARWYSRISDAVFFDDPDALALLNAIGADADEIMAP